MIKNKDLIAIVAFAVTCFTNLNAQTDAFEVGKNYLSIGYGVEVLNARNWYSEGDKENYSFSGLGPITLKYEHAFGEEFGLGVVVGYSKSSVKWTDTDGVEDYNYKFQIQKLTAVARMNWHFFTDENWDAYAGVGIGYKLSQWDFDSNDEFFEQASVNGPPVAMSMSMGARYYFSPNLGLFIETGMGHGYLQGGLQFKF